MKLFLLYMLISLNATAQDFEFNKASGKAIPNYVAELKVLRGKVFKKVGNGAELIPVAVGARFKQNDTLVTDNKSYAKVLVVDDTILSLGANSELNFSEIKFVDKTDRQIVYNFLKGQMRALVKNKAKEGDLQFKTKLAVMAVRGTDLLINHQQVNGIETTEFALFEGAVDIKDIKNKKHSLAAGERIVLISNALKKDLVEEKNRLEDQQIKVFESEDELLPYYRLTHNSLSDSEDSSPTSNEKKETENGDSQEQKKNWRYNLDRLNEKLRKNHKRNY